MRLDDRGSARDPESGASRVFVLDRRGTPLMPCHPARARKLLAKGRAVVRLHPGSGTGRRTARARRSGVNGDRSFSSNEARRRVWMNKADGRRTRRSPVRSKTARPCAPTGAAPGVSNRVSSLALALQQAKDAQPVPGRPCFKPPATGVETGGNRTLSAVVQLRVRKRRRRQCATRALPALKDGVSCGMIR